MNKENNYSHIYMPRRIWESKDLSAIEKLFMTEITNLERINNECFASNHHFSKLFNLSTTHCSKIISSLNKKHEIKIILLRNGKIITKRILELIYGIK